MKMVFALFGFVLSVCLGAQGVSFLDPIGHVTTIPEKEYVLIDFPPSIRPVPEPQPGPHPERDCEDTSSNCKMARYQPGFYCSLSWLARGCKRTCNLCPHTVPTSTPVSTPMPKLEECFDVLYNCHRANAFRCNLFWFRSGCLKSCKVCKPTTISAIPYTVSTTTRRMSEEAAAEDEIASDAAENPTTRKTTTMEAEDTTTAESEVTSGDDEIESLCVDTNPKNCQTWERIGLCYHPIYEEYMAELCSLSCRLCQP